MKAEPEKFKAIFGYLSAETPIKSFNDGAFVFCRADPLIAKRAAEFYHSFLVDYIMFTGGIGKDSGDLASKGLTEATYQRKLAIEKHFIPSSNIYTETKATNGGENCRFGIDMLLENNLRHKDLIIVCHATSLRRVAATFEVEAAKKNFKTNIRQARTNYQFNPENPIDQQEASAELLRLADWPAKGWCTAQADLPQDLVEYARAYSKQ